jgi:hypothetical protein
VSLLLHTSFSSCGVVPYQIPAYPADAAGTAADIKRHAAQKGGQGSGDGGYLPLFAIIQKNKRALTA